MLLLVFVLLPGCVGGGSPPPARAVSTAAPGTQSAAFDTTRPEFPGAAPGELQLPAPVRRAVRRELESWTLAWHAALPALRLDQFERDAVRSFAGVDEGPFVGNVAGADLRLLHLAVPSPDVLLVLDPWLEYDLVPGGEGNAVRVVRVDEPGVGIVDLRARRERRLLELPSGSRVDGAHWIDEKRVVVMSDEPARGGRRPVLHLLDLGTQTDTRYVGPLAGSEDAGLARQELDRRFLASRPALAFAR